MVKVLLVMGLFLYLEEVTDHRQEQKVIQALEQGIERLESKAAYALGYRYEIGDGVKQDFDKARSLYQQSAKLGNVKGKYRWGYLLNPDHAPNANLEESIKIMKESLADLEELWNETKDSESALYLGQMYYNGWGGVEENDNLALEWFHKAEKGGDYRVYSSLGDLYSNGKGIEDDKLAKQWYKKALDPIRKMAGDRVVYAQDTLGGMYNDGDGVKQDYKEAIKWFRKAADQGYLSSQISLGYSYQYEQGVKQDYKQAMKWYHKAADQGYSSAQLNIGVLYDGGYGVKQDYNEALKWYHKAAKQGEDYSQFNIGLLYYYGHGVKQDYKEALKWFLLSAEQGYMMPQTVLGDMYFDGNGVKKSYEKSFEWYHKAADQGEKQAQKMLGVMYYYGDGVEKNYKQAYQWYQKGASSGSADAKSRLGWWYLYGGEGVDKNIAEAIKLLKQSGSVSSYELGLMNELGWGMKINIKKAIKFYQEDKDNNFTLGMLYYLGDGVDKNEEKAKSLMSESFNDLKYAAEHYEDEDAQYALGFMYEHGVGVNMNTQTALKWYITSTEGNGPPFRSYLSIAKLYEQGVTLHGEDATKKAKEWYQITYDKMIAEEKDMVYAQYVLGLLCEEGKGINEDVKSAKRWYEKAADGGSEKAKHRLIELEKNTS